MHLVLRHKLRLVGDVPFYLKFWLNWPTPLKTATSNRYSLVTPQLYHLVKKSSIITNRKSMVHFPISLRWTVYVAPKPCKRGSKMQVGRFPYKSGLLSKKVCYKVSLCENCQWQSCKALTIVYPSVQKRLVGDAPFCVKFWVKMTHAPSFKNGDFHPIFARSNCIVTKQDNCL